MSGDISSSASRRRNTLDQRYRWAVIRKPDPDLLLAAQTGDTVALTRLLSACRTDPLWYASKHCLPSEIDEAVLDASTIISRRANASRAIAQCGRWLCLLVRHVYRCMATPLLRRRRDAIHLTEGVLAAIPSEALQLELVSALESLPAHYLEVIVSRDFEGLTIAELAERLHLTRGRVTHRLHRGRELMREYMLGSFSAARSHRE